MADALFISISELVSNTALSGNIDPNKLLPALKTVQQIEVEEILGTDLYNALSAYILAGNVPEPYLNLKLKYIHPFMIHAAVSYYIPYSSYIITNGGTSKYSGDDNHEGLSINEVSYLANKELSLAETYKKRLIDHLCFNTSLYPEYVTNTNEDINPTKTTNRTNWYL